MVAVSIPTKEHVEMERSMSKIPISSQNKYKRIFKGRELSLNVSLLLILKKLMNYFFPLSSKMSLEKAKKKDALDLLTCKKNKGRLLALQGNMWLREKLTSST